MLKLRLSIILSAAAATLTVIFGISSDIGMLTLAYRTSLSIAIFGICGYLLGFTAESYVTKLTTHNKTKGQTIDIIAKEDNFSDTEASSFSPLTPDTYEHISSQK